jgi:hypothetical protein
VIVNPASVRTKQREHRRKIVSRAKLRLVRPAERPLANLTRAEKLTAAIGFLRERNRYLLDSGSAKPKWGVQWEIPTMPATNVTIDQPRSLLERLMAGMADVLRTP